MKIKILANNGYAREKIISGFAELEYPVRQIRQTYSTNSYSEDDFYIEVDIPDDKIFIYGH